MARFVVAAASEMKPGTSKLVTVAGRDIALFNVKGEYFALFDRCPHEGGSLCRGTLTALAVSEEPGIYRLERQGEMLRCPWHGWVFDLRTGRSWCDPETMRVKHYPVTIEPGANLAQGRYHAETFPVSIEQDYLVIEV